jgi:hypothetical protein
MGNASNRGVDPAPRCGRVRLAERYEHYRSGNNAMPVRCNFEAGSRLGDFGIIMNAQTRSQILGFLSIIGVLSKSRDRHPDDQKRVRLHNKTIKVVRHQIKELEAQ